MGIGPKVEEPNDDEVKKNTEKTERAMDQGYSDGKPHALDREVDEKRSEEDGAALPNANEEDLKPEAGAHMDLPDDEKSPLL